ncbi:MAG: PHB depolymerase family esterase [Crinalium sp.]
MNFLFLKASAQLTFTLFLISITTSCDAISTLVSAELQPKISATTKQHPIRIGAATGELQHQGRQRSYYIYTPKSYNHKRPMPLVLAFHGSGSQGKDLASSSGFNQLAESQGFIIAYPNGIDRRWDVASNPLWGVNDVSFVSTLINHLKQTRSIDPRRIYAAGVSNGGFLVQRLACEPNSQIAAFGSVVATMPGEVKQSCNSKRAISMLMINGTNDDKVPWAGAKLFGYSILSVPDSIKFWRQHNGCTGKEVKKSLNKRVDISRYPNCRDGAEVELVTLKGAGHIFPRGGGGSSQLINASEEIWNFFKRHPL